MTNPVIAAVTRGGAVESVHRGAVAVADASGALALALGDVRAPVFPRSAVKALQALPVVESGAAEAYGLDDEALALTVASHSGEPAHAATAARALAAAGFDASALECGTHWPMGEAAARALAATGASPSALHNNCSGKHAGFLCLCARAGWGARGYARPEHEAMRAVTASVEQATGERVDPSVSGTDGCSIPAHAWSLAALARGFARLGTGQGLGEGRARAAARLRAAVAAAPWMVAGTGRFDTEAMGLFGARALVKMGAEGVHCGALPALGLGYAIKCDDGAVRAAEAAAAALLRRFLRPEGAEAEALARLERRPLVNWNGLTVGAVAPAGALAG